MDNKLLSADPPINIDKSTPGEILQWAWTIYSPNIAATSSFQTQSLPLLHHISLYTPDLPIYFIDTGFHFKESLVYRDRLVKMFKLNIKVIKPALEGNEFVDKFGELYNEKPDTCCYINKILPLKTAMAGKAAWISGIRRDQTTFREGTQIISDNSFLGLKKICPIANWSLEEINDYILENKLPKHPLWDLGYRSIGCAPCTDPVSRGEKDRDGRWRGFDHFECGMQII